MEDNETQNTSQVKQPTPDKVQDKKKAPHRFKRTVSQNRSSPQATAPPQPLKSHRFLHDKRDFSSIMTEDMVDTTRSILWQCLNAGSSSSSPRHFCCVCGFHAPYKCSSCALRQPVAFTRYFCSLGCYKIHKRVDCCKPRSWCVVT